LLKENAKKVIIVIFHMMGHKEVSQEGHSILAKVDSKEALEVKIKLQRNRESSRTCRTAKWADSWISRRKKSIFRRR
jgi:hypothetical protein